MARTTAVHTAWKRVQAYASKMVRVAMVASVLLTSTAALAAVSVPAAHAEEAYCGGDC